MDNIVDFNQIISSRKNIDLGIAEIVDGYTVPTSSLLNIFEFLKQTTRVLLVEDDPLTRQLVRRCLKGECMLATAGTAKQAIEICADYHPDLIFLDLGLPDVPGENVLEWVKLNKPQTSVVLFTNSEDNQLITCLMNRGAIGYIPKPFMRNDFIEYIEGEKLF